MEISKESILVAAQKLLFSKTDLEPRIKHLGGKRVFFFARADAEPPWVQNDEQFRFKFLAYYDPQKEEIKIEAVSASLVNTSAKNSKPLFEKTFWPSTKGRMHSKEQMILEVLKIKNPQQSQIDAVREKFGMAGFSRQERNHLPTQDKGVRIRH